MTEELVDQGRSVQLSRRQTWKVGLGLSGVALLVALALTATAVNLLCPMVPGGARGFGARVGWYFQNGQLQADARTFTAALQYMMQTDGETPAFTNFANLPVAGTTNSGSPKS